MARPEAQRLDPAHYPHHGIIQTRFQDLDVLGHVNNVAVVALFETGRVRFNQDIGVMRPRGMRFLVARTEINYLAEGHFPEDVTACHGIGRIGNRSWDVLALLTQGGRAIATVDVTIVLSAEGGATTLPDDFRSLLEAARVTG